MYFSNRLPFMPKRRPTKNNWCDVCCLLKVLPTTRLPFKSVTNNFTIRTTTKHPFFCTIPTYKDVIAKKNRLYMSQIIPAQMKRVLDDLSNLMIPRVDNVIRSLKKWAKQSKTKGPLTNQFG
jgi:hypothetical protein